MSTSKVMSFKSAVRGFHVYRNCWHPQENEVLNCFHESNNPFDMFAIQVCQLQTNKRVGHLPMEISRISKFLIDRGAVFQAKLMSIYYRRSPLVRGGLENPCEITVRMTKTACNDALLERYDNLVNDLYLEPVSDEVLGCFLDLETNLQAPKTETLSEREMWNPKLIKARLPK